MKLTGYTLRIGFADKADAKEFLRLIAYMQHCGDVGHSTGITVNADGDGSFKMLALVRDPEDGEYRNVRDVLQVPEGHWRDEVDSYREWKESQKADGIPEGNIDRNEIAFDLGD